MSTERINKTWAKRVQKVTKQITHADLTDSDTSQSFDFAAALPDEAVVLASYVDVDEQFASAGSATAAEKECDNAPTYDMAPGDTLVVDVDNAGNATCTWDAAQGYQIDNSYYPIADQDGKTIIFEIDGAEQTVTFSGATTTQAQVQAACNAQLTGVAVTQHTAIEKAATKVCSAGPYNMAPGDTMVIDVDNVGNATCTFDAAAATCTDTTSYDCADQDGKTEKVTIDGGEEQTVTFSGATTTAASVASQMNAQLVGCKVEVDGVQVKITSDKKGTGSSVAIGTGTCDLTWDTPVAGTGDVVDIDAVTEAEFKTVVEADSTAEVDVTGAAPVISSPTTGASSELDFKSGNVLAIAGLSVEVIVGTAAQTKVTSDTYGTDSTVEVTGGTSDVVWNAKVDGTGDVADIDAVTAAEVKTVIEADSTAEVDITGANPVISSPTTGDSSELDFKSGNALAILGIDVEVITGETIAAGTATLDLGVSGGDTDALLDGADLSSATGKVNSPKGAAPEGHYGGETLAAKIDGTVNVDQLTAGDATATVLYVDTELM